MIVATLYKRKRTGKTSPFFFPMQIWFDTDIQCVVEHCMACMDFGSGEYYLGDGPHDTEITKLQSQIIDLQRFNKQSNERVEELEQQLAEAKDNLEWLEKLYNNQV